MYIYERRSEMDTLIYLKRKLKKIDIQNDFNKIIFNVKAVTISCSLKNIKDI